MTVTLQETDRLVFAPLPGSAWVMVFMNHFAWALDAKTKLSEDERLSVARQLIVLYEAAVQGAPADQDDTLTQMRAVLAEAMRLLGYKPEPGDGALTKYVFRATDLRSVLTKLQALAAS